MTTAAEKAREKAVRMAARRQEPNASKTDEILPSDNSSISLPRGERAKPVRLTVDLAPQMHADLEDWARDSARASGRTRITRVDVVRELVRQLLDDPALADRVRSRLVGDR